MNIRCLTLTLGSACCLSLFTGVLRAQDTPSIVNPETTLVVELTRAYWDANADIADRTVQCDYFSYNQTSAAFELMGDSSGPPNEYRERTQSYFHLPLPDITPHMNYAQVGDASPDDNRSIYQYIPLWGVVDGVYSGLAPLAESEFVEIVSYRSADNDAVRVWYDDTLSVSYHVCYAVDGQPLIPTGSSGAVSSYISLPDFSFEFPSEIDLSDGIPEFTNLQTGEPVKLVRGDWSYNRHIAYGRFECINRVWFDDSEQYSYAGDGSNSSYIFNPYNGGDTVTVAAQSDNAPRYGQTQPVDQLDFTAVSFERQYMELTDEGFRMWSSNEFYRNCVVSKIKQANGNGYGNSEHIFWQPPFTPDRVLPLSWADCDYTDAENYDGWGWNPVTNEPCPPLNEVSGSDPQTVSDTDDVNNTQNTGNGSSSGDDSDASGNDSSGSDNSAASGDGGDDSANGTAQSSGGGTAGCGFLCLLAITTVCQRRRKAARRIS